MTSSSRRAHFDERTTAELITLIASVVVLAAIIGGLLAMELARGDRQPRISVEPSFDDAYEFNGDWYLPVTIRNDGDRGTETVRVDLLRAAGPDSAPEVADISHDFLAGGARVDALAVFDEQPTAETVTVDIVSITQP